MTLSISLSAEIIMTGMSRSSAAGFHALQHLIPVHVGHHDVEQNEIKWLRLQEIERFTPVDRRRQIV